MHRDDLKIDDSKPNHSPNRTQAWGARQTMCRGHGQPGHLTAVTITSSRALVIGWWIWTSTSRLSKQQKVTPSCWSLLHSPHKSSVPWRVSLRGRERKINHGKYAALRIGVSDIGREAGILGDRCHDSKDTSTERELTLQPFSFLMCSLEMLRFLLCKSQRDENYRHNADVPAREGLCLTNKSTHLYPFWSL